MELYTMTIRQPEVVRPTIYCSTDMHGEELQSGFCEYCWTWELADNLVNLHEILRPWSHILAHNGCAQKMADWENCDCAC